MKEVLTAGIGGLISGVGVISDIYPQLTREINGTLCLSSNKVSRFLGGKIEIKYYERTTSINVQLLN